jgi:hypothetical protein
VPEVRPSKTVTVPRSGTVTRLSGGTRGRENQASGRLAILAARKPAATESCSHM